ncbi:MAG TPA: YggT family protein [Chloroflexota bacterium]|nr:YggT family protein [Chloroflexota bacterium]
MSVLNTVLSAISLLVNVLVFAIIIQALMSWFVPRGAGKFSILLAEITDPILMPIRRFIPPLGGLDLSPLIAILLLEFVIGPVLSRLTLTLAGV